MEAARELVIALKEDKDGFVDINDVVNTEVECSASTEKFLDSDMIVVDVAVGMKGERTCLQLYE
jgi:hypothetical protein